MRGQNPMHACARRLHDDTLRCAWHDDVADGVTDLSIAKLYGIKKKHVVVISVTGGPDDEATIIDNPLGNQALRQLQKQIYSKTTGCMSNVQQDVLASYAACPTTKPMLCCLCTRTIFG